MKTVLTSLGGAWRACVAAGCLAVLALGMSSSRAYTTGQFAGVQTQIHDDIAALGALPSPTRQERALLRALQRGSNALTKITVADGKMLRSLNSVLGRQTNYIPTLGAIRSSLLAGFNAEYAFVENFLPELPDSPAATVIKAQFQKFDATAAKHDGAKRKLDDILFRASQAAVIPFPSDLSLNSVSAKIGSVNFRTSLGAASDNVFSAVATETNVSLTLGAIVNSGGTGPRGILFSIPNAALGAFRHAIPTAVDFTNRTGIYSPEETNTGATNGSVFINVTSTEVYGVFSCSGPGFNITDGKFRITLSQAE
jgi:hypothetical protein